MGTGPDGRSDTGDEAALPQLNGPEVEIVGSNLAGSTLTISADGVTIRGDKRYAEMLRRIGLP